MKKMLKNNLKIRHFIILGQILIERHLFRGFEDIKVFKNQNLVRDLVAHQNMHEFPS